MTIDRMVELLELEHTCMLRRAHDDCDRHCANCELVQDDGELHEMYTDVIAHLKEQEAVEPKHIDGKRNHYNKCGNCNYDLLTGFIFCPHCGKKVKWG